MCELDKKCGPCSIKANLKEAEVISKEGAYATINRILQKKEIEFDEDITTVPLDKLGKMLISTKEAFSSATWKTLVQCYKVIKSEPINESKKLNEFIDFNNPKAVADEKKQFSRIKDLDVIRPGRMAPAPVDNLPTKSYATKRCDLYVQDEANDIFVDKAGFERGYKNWMGTIDAGGGVMFQAANSIANQKWVMCRDLGIENQLERDYFFRSYFDIWKQWSGKSGAPTVKKPVTEPKATPTFKKAAKPIVSKTPKFTAKFTTVTPNSKDEMRMNDLLNSSNPYGQASKMVSVTNDINKLIGRGKELASRGKQSLADIFFAKAKKLLGESKMSFIDKVLLEAKLK